jgi:hypothetical protein
MGFLEYARSLLADAGLHQAEELREYFLLPETPLLCREIKLGNWSELAQAPLLHAAILGLCNYGVYSPNRPFIWTEARLARQVELFNVKSFYAD